ncbi:MAG: ABC transporter substrate-binding protein [Bacteroidales bacterium]|jgi:peptide/nickel transport system substrate-binding protein|nr:ABC transporter substrate-binding protein [Bacteroidales bacterium]
MIKTLLIPLIFSLFIVSCSEQKVKHSNVFRYNESKGIATLDPAFAKSQVLIWPVNQLFNGLVQMNNQLVIKPAIARSWEVSEKGKLYTFFLRTDVRFHNSDVFPGGKGRIVTAHDFEYSLKRITDPKTGSPGAWIFNQVDEEGIIAINDTTLEIRLKNPFSAFLGLLTMPYCSVIPKEAIEYYKQDFRNHPVGTGPFQFKFWKEGEKLILIKNQNYFEKDSNNIPLPYLDAVSITFINDKQSEFLEFLKGNIDFISGLSPANKDELITRNGSLNPKYEGKIKMISQPYLNTEYLGFLLDSSKIATKNSPVLNKKIRQAINYGFDREKMMKYLRNNIGSPAIHGFIPKGLPSFSRSLNGFTYNPGKTRELLKEAGFPDGQGLAPIKLTTTSDYLDLCEYIQQELSQFGIELIIDVSTGATFREMVAQSKLEFFRGSWIADYPDAENYMALFYSQNFSPSGPNYTHYANKNFDKLYQQAMNETTDSIRYSLYHQMNQQIINDAVVVPLYYDEVVRFAHTNIKGFESNPMNLLNLKQVYKTN